MSLRCLWRHKPGAQLHELETLGILYRQCERCDALLRVRPFFTEWRGSMDGRPTMWIRRLLWIPIWWWAGKVRSVRIDLHKFVAADDHGCFHTHPAWAVRIILRGGYREEVLIGDEKYRRVLLPGDVGLVAPTLAHRVESLASGGPSYSLWIRGPICADVQLLGDGWAKQKSTAAGKGDPYNAGDGARYPGGRGSGI